MTYKDKTFCGAKDCLNFPTCHRALTDEVWEQAERAELPISQFADPKELECYNQPTKPQEP